MFNFGDPETFWLNVTNALLGLVTFVCCAAIAHGIYKELRVRVKRPALASILGDDHAFLEPQLGIIMADGGEKMDKHPAPRHKASAQGNEANIVRSEN